MPGPAPGTRGNASPLQAAIEQGLDYLSQESEYTFQEYTQTVLPIDGYVFWTPTAAPQTVKGSLHYGLETVQEADELAGDGSVVFTTNIRVMSFGQTKSPRLYVVTVGENQTDDPLKNPVRFAFSSQGNFYPEAGTWHYHGRRVMPALASQLLDKGVAIDPSRAIVSNSLPLWLALNSYESGVPVPAQAFTLYPAFLAAENAVPPYATVEIKQGPDAIASAPLLGSQFGSHTQLVKDVVEITFYGLQNNEALSFQDRVNQYSLDTDALGIMNMPVAVDVPRTAAELKTIAMKKCMRFEVSYYQSITETVAHQLILAASATVQVNPDPL